jgi:hypothetical protein
MARTGTPHSPEHQSALAPLPARLDDPSTGIVHGLFAGRTPADPLAFGPRGGRSRRWRYVSAGDGATTVGALAFQTGPLGVAYAWLQLGARTSLWERRTRAGRSFVVDRGLDGQASVRLPGARLQLDPDGGLRIDVPAEGGQRLTALVRPDGDVTPAVAVTGTPDGGWNATQKAAGYAVTGWVRLGDGDRVALGVDAGGWRDATSGRQDRVTTWRWAVGSGSSADGRRVGFTTSTGWHAGSWEDVVWWDGVPHHLTVDRLQPQDEWDQAGDWVVGGPDWELWLEPRGLRAKDERLPFLSSRYMQPMGTFTGTLPDPAGKPVEVRLHGVTEDHLAVW